MRTSAMLHAIGGRVSAIDHRLTWVRLQVWRWTVAMVMIVAQDPMIG